MDYVGLECVNGSLQQRNIYTATTMAKIVALGLIDLVVVLGNSLVIAAVITTRKLRTVTNIFIVSLACADLMIGFAVLPFSISYEVVKLWLWGNVWCSMWLAIDVWLCTASILSLCAISFDRYIAVTHPIRYPSLISPFRGKVLVFSVWILSFVICLPPLLGWNDSGSNEKQGQDKNSLKNSSHTHGSSSFSYLNKMDISTDIPTEFYLYEDIITNLSLYTNNSNQCSFEVPLCELTPTKGYRIYAAMGSFFIPSLVMVFFYLRIYLTAMKTAKSLRSGVLLTRTSAELAQHHGGSSDDAIQLRIHRGGSTTSSFYVKKRNSNTTDSLKLSTGASDMYKHATLSPRVSRESSNHQISDQGDCSPGVERRNKNNNNSSKRFCSVMFWTPTGKRQTKSRLKCDIQKSEGLQTEQLLHKRNGNLKERTDNRFKIKFSPKKCKLLIKEAKTLNTKGHARKFHRETKAAKTLAIIVGAFIVCWFPFFTIYLLGAFCHDCVSDIIFSIFFWLGYINSALNPCIYALFARDFRAAFRKIVLCKRRNGFNKAARADYVTGIRNNVSQHHEMDSFSD